MQEIILPTDTSEITSQGLEFFLTMVFFNSTLILVLGDCHTFFKSTLSVDIGTHYDNIDWNNTFNHAPIVNQQANLLRCRGDLMLVGSFASEKHLVLTFINMSKIYHDKTVHLKEFALNDYLIIKSPPMRQIVNIIKQIASVDSTVLLLGESGVGKSAIAKLIHKESNRHDKPFVCINCGALPETLIETELFGYEPGTFTGGEKRGKQGLFEIADGGVIFLDEIAELPLKLQVKLLEVLQEGTIRKVGGMTTKKINVRVITSTNKDLVSLTKQNAFREDLYYRINVVPIKIPSLRERKEDIPELINFFLSKYNTKYGTNKKLSPALRSKLGNYAWPGNVRELENTIHRAVVTNSEIAIDALNIRDTSETATEASIEVKGILPLKTAKSILEKVLVTRAYNMYGSTYKAADILKIDQSTVSKIIKKHRIEKPATN